MRYDSCICDMTHTRHDSFIYVTWIVLMWHASDVFAWLMTHPYMCMSRDSLVLCHMNRATYLYSLATASRLFKLLHLFLCQNKILLQKRPSKIGVMNRRHVTEEVQRRGPVWPHSYDGMTHSYAHMEYFTNPTNSKSKCDVTRWCIYILRWSIHIHA